MMEKRQGRLQPISLFPMNPDKTFLHCEVNLLAKKGLKTRVGVAIDLGTTCIDLFLWDLGDNCLLVSARGENRQRCHGQDVISRISAANTPGIGLAKLQALAAATINQLLSVCLEATGIKRTALIRVALAGNTAMTLIFAKIDPLTLGTYPHAPPITEIPIFMAQGLGLDLAPKVPIYIFPVVSGFIGGDTVSALVAHGPFDTKKTCLLVDIGTNGELVLSHGNRIMAASCATGPAFEGAKISWGMPAGEGAIDHMDISISGRFSWQVMGKGGKKPAGICGSGMVDALGALVRAGVLSPSGLLDQDSPLVTKNNQTQIQVELVAADKTRHGRALTLSQKDIGELQLAKAAVCAGIELLLCRSGADHVDEIVLTGAFGAGFDWGNAVAIGMLPEVLLAGKIRSTAGLVGEGVIMALTDPGVKTRALALSRQINLLELGGDLQFQDRFLSALAFPVQPLKKPGKP